MSQNYLSAKRLLECRLRTTDGAWATLQDLIIVTGVWEVGFLAAEVEGWVPDRQVLLLPADVAGVDSARGEIELALDAPALRASPTLAAGPDLSSLDADMAPPGGWRDQWAADADPEGTGQTPPLAPDPVEPRALDLAEGAEVIRADTLRGYAVETPDGDKLHILDLLVDDADWSIALVELAMKAEGERRAAGRAEQTARCLVARGDLDWLDRSSQKLHIAVWADELRSAPLIPHPAATGGGAKVRMLADRS